MGLDNIDLFGYSMGGRLAIKLLFNYPKRFHKGIYLSIRPALFADERESRIQWEQKMMEELDKLSLEKWIENWYQLPIFTNFHPDPAFLERRYRLSKEEIKRQFTFFSVTKQPDFYPLLASTTNTHHFIYGENDPIKQRHLPLLNDLDAPVFTHLISNTSHNPHLQNPSSLSTLLKEILC